MFWGIEKMRLALAALLAIGFNNAFAQEPEPCTSTTSECTEWVSLPDDLSRLLVYRTYPLDTRNEEITRALLMVHGKIAHHNYVDGGA